MSVICKIRLITALGRDFDGVEFEGGKTLRAACDVFKLNGDRALQGKYEITLDKATYAFTLRETFPQFP